jgi:hypothetical protein
LGVAVQILSGATPACTIIINSGPGTTRGLNRVVWDGTDGNGNTLLPGNYTVQIIAESSGYLSWTQINQATDPGYSVFWPDGIAVDTSTNSPYYGRIMVANGAPSSAYQPGIYKLNADGSYADEGPAGVSTAGYAFRTDGGDGDSCRCIAYGTDDRVYFNDWYGNGRVVACDMIMSTNQIIWDSGSSPAFKGLAYGCGYIDVTDPGTTNGLVWCADNSDYPGIGIWVFPLTNNGVADSASAGIQVVAIGPDIGLRAGNGLAIDEWGDIFVGQTRANAGDPAERAINITNVWGASFGYPTNWWNNAGSYPITSTDLNWAVGSADNTMEDSSSVAIDSRTNPQYVSVTFNGGAGGMKILYATNGALVANIEQSAGVYYVGTGWDNVGNVYAGSAAGYWAEFSPPGANAATTPAVATVTVTAPPTPPHITSITSSGGTVTIRFTGGASDPSSAFTLLSSAVVGPLASYTPAAGATITGSAGSYTATVAVGGNIQFYRIKR